MPSESVEDYLEAIYGVVKRKGYARTSDIKDILGHSAASVTEMFQRLGREGYVNYEKYGGVTLTEKGLKIAKAVSKRHEILSSFLQILGISTDIAEEDACKIEHSVHEDTMEILTRFVEFVRNAPRGPRWLEHFMMFRETGEIPECIGDKEEEEGKEGESKVENAGESRGTGEKAESGGMVDEENAIVQGKKHKKRQNQGREE